MPFQGLRHSILLTVMAVATTVGCGNEPAGPPAPTKLGFVTQPSTTAAAQLIAPAVQIAIQDPFGRTVTGAENAVTIALGANPGGATLSGTLTVYAVAGMARFADLRLDRPAIGYTFAASAGDSAGRPVSRLRSRRYS